MMCDYENSRHVLGLIVFGVVDEFFAMIRLGIIVPVVDRCSFCLHRRIFS